MFETDADILHEKYKEFSSYDKKEKNFKNPMAEKYQFPDVISIYNKKVEISECIKQNKNKGFAEVPIIKH